MPRAGGDYFFIKRTFGSLLGSVSGLLSWLALSLKSAFAIVGIAELLAILLALVAAGFRHVEVTRFDHFLPYGRNAVVQTAGFVFVSFGGLLTTASIAGEVRDPQRTLPAALIVSLVVVTVIYTLVSFISVGVLPAAAVAKASLGERTLDHLDGYIGTLEQAGVPKERRSPMLLPEYRGKAALARMIDVF
jgi:amino acid transporter